MPENKEKDDNDGLLEGRRIVYHRFLGYEYKSKTTLWGLPLLHIHFGFGFCRAKGIIAIGAVPGGDIVFDPEAGGRFRRTIKGTEKISDPLIFIKNYYTPNSYRM